MNQVEMKRRMHEQLNVLENIAIKNAVNGDDISFKCAANFADGILLFCHSQIELITSDEYFDLSKRFVLSTLRENAQKELSKDN